MSEKQSKTDEYLQLVPGRIQDLGNVALNRELLRAEPPCGETDPAIFFNEGPSHKLAKALCERCDVRPACLELALRKNDKGFRAGLSENARQPLIKARKAHLKQAKSGTRKAS